MTFLCSYILNISNKNLSICFSLLVSWVSWKFYRKAFYIAAFSNYCNNKKQHLVDHKHHRHNLNNNKLHNIAVKISSAWLNWCAPVARSSTMTRFVPHLIQYHYSPIPRYTTVIPRYTNLFCSVTTLIY